MFAIFLFLMYYLEQNLGFTPMQAGAAFLPMIAMVMVAAVVSGTVLMPRTGPRRLVAPGTALASVGILLLTLTGTESTYAGSVLPSLMVTGLGFGFIFGPIQNAATAGVDADNAGIASAMVNTSQQVVGSVGVALFTAIFSLSTARASSSDILQPATVITGYHYVFWVGAAIFAAATVLTVPLFPKNAALPTIEASRSAPRRIIRSASPNSELGGGGRAPRLGVVPGDVSNPGLAFRHARAGEGTERLDRAR